MEREHDNKDHFAKAPFQTQTAAASVASRAFRREIRRLVGLRHTAASVSGTQCYAALPSSSVHARYAHTFGSFSGFFIVRGGNDALYMDAMLQQVAPGLPAGPERHVLRTASSLLRPLTQQLTLPVRAHSIANAEIQNLESVQAVSGESAAASAPDKLSAVASVSRDLAQRAFAIAQAVHAGPEPQMAVIMNPVTFAPVCMMVNAACCAMIGAEPVQYHREMQARGTLLRHGLLMDPDQALLVSATDLNNVDAARELVRRGSCDPNIQALAGVSPALLPSPAQPAPAGRTERSTDEDLSPIAQSSDEAVMGDNSSASGSFTTPAELASRGTTHRVEQGQQQDYQGGWHVVLDIMQRLVDASCQPISKRPGRITNGLIGEALSTTHGAVAVPHGMPLPVHMTLSFHCLGARGCFPLCMTKMDASPLADPWGQLLPPAGGNLPTAGDTDYWPGVAGNPHASPSLAQYLAVQMLAGDPDSSGTQEERLEHVHQFSHPAGWLGPVATALGVSVRSAAARLATHVESTLVHAMHKRARIAASAPLLRGGPAAPPAGAPGQLRSSFGGHKRQRDAQFPVQLLGLAMRTLGGALEPRPLAEHAIPARAQTAVQAAVASMAQRTSQISANFSEDPVSPPSQRARR